MEPLQRPSDHDLARLLKALGHPARIAIVRHLLDTRGCICGDIVRVVPLAQSTVSQHLKVLKEAGLIRGTVAGPCICYCLDPEAAGRIRDAVGRLFEPGAPGMETTDGC